MRLNIHNYRDYKVVIQETLKERGRGSQARLSEKIRCTRSYLSQVINADQHLTMEQGYLCAQFMGLDDEYTRFFLLLIQHQRTEAVALKKFLTQEIDEFRRFVSTSSDTGAKKAMQQVLERLGK